MRGDGLALAGTRRKAAQEVSHDGTSKCLFLNLIPIRADEALQRSQNLPEVTLKRSPRELEQACAREEERQGSSFVISRLRSETSASLTKARCKKNDERAQLYAARNAP